MIVNGRDARAVDEVVAAIGAAGGKALPAVFDVSDADATGEAIDAVSRDSGDIGILVNCATSRQHGDAVETSLEQWREALDVSVTGTFLCIRAVLPGMRANRWGRIVNFAGVSAQAGAAGRVAIAAAKSAVIGLTKAVARDEAASGITVNAISPGIIDTERTTAAQASAFYRDQIASTPAGRLGTTEEVAELCAYLSSAGAGFVTGQVMAINGGLYM